MSGPPEGAGSAAAAGRGADGARRPAPGDRTPEWQATLDRLRACCTRLPEVAEEIDGFGHTVFRVRGKSFAIMGTELHLSIKADHASQDVLRKTGRWIRTPYIGQHGWVSVADFADVDWGEVAELVEDGWRLAAPKTAVREWEERQ